MIIRVEHDKNYAVIHNVPLNDERLSWEARGVLAYLLSKPDKWEVRPADLQKNGLAGRDKIRRILNELKEFGYLKRQRVPGDGGKFEWISTIIECPDPTQEPLELPPCPENPSMAPPCPEKPSTDNQGIYKVLNRESTDTLNPSDLGPDKPAQNGHRVLIPPLVDLCFNGECSKGARIAIAKLAKRFFERGITMADIEKFRKWWYSEWWKGQKGQPPMPSEVENMWATCFKKSEPAVDLGAESAAHLASIKARHPLGVNDGHPAIPAHF